MPLTPLDDIYRERRFPWPAAVLGAVFAALCILNSLVISSAFRFTPARRKLCGSTESRLKN